MKTRSKIALISAFGGAAFGLGACHSATGDWSQASKQNTVAAYQNFVAAHPKDTHASEAQALILQLQDDNAWTEAQHAGTTTSYQSYLQQYPTGSHAVAARDTMTSIDRAAEWKTVQDSGSAASLQAFLQKYPTGSEADQAKAKLKEITGYRVRLASEPSDSAAQHRLTQLKARFGGQLQDLVVTPDAAKKSFFIESGGTTEQAAKSACDSVKRAHQTCQVVQE